MTQPRRLDHHDTCKPRRITMPHSLIRMLALTVGAYAGLLQAASPSETPSSAKPIYGPLSAELRGQIQAIGQGVLSAKAAQQPTAEELALLQTLHGLAASLDQAIKFTQPMLKPQLNLGAGPSAPATHDTLRYANRTKLDAQVGAKLDQLRQQRRDIDALPAGDATGPDRAGHLRHLSEQAGVLQQDVENALALADDNERAARLRDLRQRLQSRTLAEWWQDRKDEAQQVGTPLPAADTPTLSTQIRHRRGLDDVRKTKR